MRFAYSVMSVLTCVSFVCLSGCTEENRDHPLATAKKGEGCIQTLDCEAGFECSEQICTAVVSQFENAVPLEAYKSVYGDSCALSWECQDGLVCNAMCGKCTSQDGNELDIVDDCPGSKNLNLPTEFYGAKGFGEECKTLTLDCRLPLFCGVNGKCSRLPDYKPALCSQSDNDTGDFRAFFEIPSEDILDGTTQAPDNFEFYRLPFPNDIRRDGEKLLLSGHVASGEAFGIKVKDAYLGAAETLAGGYPLNPMIFFRFSDLIDAESLCVGEGESRYPMMSTVETYASTVFGAGLSFTGEVGAPDLAGSEGNFCGKTDKPTVYLVNLDKTEDPISLQLRTGRKSGQYICNNWVGVTPADGTLLKPGTSYAAIVTNGIKNWKGTRAVADTHFTEVLKGSLPKYEKLRTYLDDPNAVVSKGAVVGATVFTTSSPTSVAWKFKNAVKGATGPGIVHSFDGVGNCNKGETSSKIAQCSDLAKINIPGLDGDITAVLAKELGLDTRGCNTSGSASYERWQGAYSAPRWQVGTRPYLAEGGDIDFETTEREEICFSAAVPTARDQALPVIIYAHGTGGSFVSMFADQTAALAEAGFVVIGYDNVMHGTRASEQGDGAADMTALSLVADQLGGQLFFNIFNPAASRGNVFQGGADLMYLLKLIKTVKKITTANGEVVNLDTERIFFFGHSQGAVVSPTFLATLDQGDLSGVVLSGIGGDLALSVLNKKQPLDVRASIGPLLGDQSLGRVHPILGLFGAMFSSADMISYASEVFKVPTLILSGIGDGYTPDATQSAFFTAAEVPIINKADTDSAMAGVSTTTKASNNLNGVTAAVKRVVYHNASGSPSGDPHFVTFEESDAIDAMKAFFNTLKDSPNVTIQ